MMNVSLVRLSVAVALAAAARPVHAANMRDHLESRRLSPLVYVGVVAKDQTVVERGRVGLIAEARVRVLGVAKGGSDKVPAEARLRCSSYDEKTPPVEGGPQYQLKAGTCVVAFVSSFADERPAYLISGDKEQVREFVEKLRGSLAQMTAAQLAFHEINEAGRKAQLTVYDRTLELLAAP